MKPGSSKGPRAERPAWLMQVPASQSAHPMCNYLIRLMLQALWQRDTKPNL